MKFKIWDKQEQINGVSAEIVLENSPFFKIDDVILIIDDYDIVTRIESVRIIKSVFNLDKNLNAEEVAQHLIKELEKEQEEFNAKQKDK